ncbi:MAG TPA: extracellular solute-binding protein [Pyrinomonadaceae bacterium]|jgi:multiple sugar transport system substrate-binding protein
MKNELNIALVSGPAYDPLYESLPEFTAATGAKVNVAFSGDHPSLNHHLAGLEQVPYDLVSTHTKYAPSQMEFLAPLDDLIDADGLEDFVPLLLKLSTIDGALYGLPRNIDVRLLHYRTDIIASPPATWDELFDIAKKHNSPPDCYGFLYPGKESGLFGTFYELAEMAGATLFPENLVPDIENEAGDWALGLLRKFYQEGIVPEEFTNWHYDEIHARFRDGRAAMLGDWPGYYSLYKDPKISAVHNRFALSPYPVGPAGKLLVYGGGHTFALTRKGADNPSALKLLLFLTAFERQLLEAENGCVPVRRSVMRQMQSAADEENRARLAMLEGIISEHLLIPPKFSAYPKIEEVLWRTVQSAIVGQIPIGSALRSIREQIENILLPENSLLRFSERKGAVSLESGISY